MQKHVGLVAMMLLASGCQGSGGVDELAQANASGEYLALGDSTVFGYVPNADPAVLENFRGYPELLGERYGLSVTNASCPGETSGSYRDVQQPDDLCRAWRAAGNAMHVTYTGGSQSQAAFARDWLTAHPGARLVTIAIGANDLLVNKKQCASWNLVCLYKALVSTKNTAADNLGAVIDEMRAVYAGPIVLVNYFAPTQSDSLVVKAVKDLNEALAARASQKGVPVADAYQAFYDSDPSHEPCYAGLLVPSGATCDRFASPAGQSLLADVVSKAAGL